VERKIGSWNERLVRGTKFAGPSRFFQGFPGNPGNMPQVLEKPGSPTGRSRKFPGNTKKGKGGCPFHFLGNGNLIHPFQALEKKTHDPDPEPGFHR
jgi:hypothetical protein